MAENQYGRLQSPSQELVKIPLAFAPAGTDPPTAVVGKGFSIARTDVGKYRITFTERYPALLGFSWSLALQTLAVRTVVLKAITIGMAATNTIDIQILDASAAAVEIAAHANNLVLCEFTFSNTSSPSA